MLEGLSAGARRAWCIFVACHLAAAAASCRTAEPEKAGGTDPRPENTQASGIRSPDEVRTMLTLQSKAFRRGGEIPRKFTCQGDDVSPPLSWSGVPQGTKSLALIVDDPDAPDPARPKRVWVHWIVFNLPPSVSELPEAVKRLPAPARSGVNDWNRELYGGPCPPIGRHRYFFKLYALDASMALESPTKADLQRAMEGHILQSAELMGTYQKQ